MNVIVVSVFRWNSAGYLQLAQLDGATEVWIDPDAAGFAQPQMLVRLAQVLPSDLNF